MKHISKLFIALLLSCSFLFADEPANDLNAERVAGTLVKMTGKYKFVFSVTKDWKTLHMIVTDLKDQPVLIDLAKVEVSVRPDERTTPFQVVMTSHSEKQDGIRQSTHYKGDLNFIDNFKGFRASAVIMIGDEKLVSEYSFKRE